MAGYVKLRKKAPLTMKRIGDKLPKLVPLDIPFPLKGIHLEVPRDQAPAGAAVDTDGILLRDGALARSPGRSVLGSVRDDEIVLISTYIDSAGVKNTLIATPDDLYKLSGDWTQIPKSPAGDMGGVASDLFWSTQIGSDLLFCQGVDKVYRYSGGSDFGIIHSDCPSALFGIGHQGRLLLGFTVESGIDYPYRIRWNVIDDIDDWTGSGSGYIDLDDTSDTVSCIALLNDYPVVFKKSSIIIGNRTGQISPAYEFFNRDSRNGTRCPYAVVNLGDSLVYIGESDIFMFDLNKSTPISNSIRTKFFDEINPQYIGSCFGYLVEDLDEVRFCTPTGSRTYNDLEWVWNRKTGVWTRQQREVKYAGLHYLSTAETWNSLSDVTWDSFNTRWGSGVLEPSGKKIIFGARDGRVYVEDISTFSMNGSAFESFYEFGDIQIDPSKYTGISYIEVRYKDTGSECSLTVGVSDDAGKSWQEDTRSLRVEGGSGKILKTLFFNSISGTNVSIRLYVNSASAYFEIVGVRVWLTSVGR